MKIYLLDKSRRMVEAWKKYFESRPEVEIVNQDFMLFMKLYDVECVVSPANAYGLMDGGYDLAITNHFGVTLQQKVQQKIVEKYYGEQHVGTSLIVDIPNTNKKLIHTPTMRYPEQIRDDKIIYQCMRATLIEAINNNVKSIVIPAFGGCTGGVSCDRIAELMYKAYLQILYKPEKINWDYAFDWNVI